MYVDNLVIAAKFWDSTERENFKRGMVPTQSRIFFMSFENNRFENAEDYRVTIR